MAKFIYELNQSLDGYVDHDKFMPAPDVFRYFVEQTRAVTGMFYGRRMYEIMRYWDEDSADWNDDEKEYAVAWRAAPKWVISRSLNEVGPNATLVADNVEASVRKLKAEMEGEFEVAGPELAQSFTDLGLIDEYRLDIHPVVLGGGKPFFVKQRAPLRLIASDIIGEGVIRLTYVPG
jgi:dihydrofolate reductase